MEILYLLPGDGMPDEELDRRRKTANAIARPDTNVTVMEVGEGPLSIESAIEHHMAVAPMLRKLLEIREEGKYDAIMIGCAGDPGLEPSRELMDIPIIGPAESSYLFACMLSDRFSILSILRAGEASGDGVRARVREMGLEARLASVEFVEDCVTDMWSGGKSDSHEQVATGVDMAKRNGAGSVVLGCMSMAFNLVDEVVENPALPIVNPLKVAIKTAETFVDLGMQHSKVTYPAADFKKLMETVF
ncbi:MAG: aspartate/glutamate racemase family protein [Candidatus Thorarchaeota archaeon]|jgi:allantoin racemase